MEKLIIIEGKNKYQFKNLKNLIEAFLDKNFYNMTKKEQKEILEMKAIANTMLKDIKIIKPSIKNKKVEENDFVIYDEFTYILSLAKFNIIMLLEENNANIFGEYIKELNSDKNYIIINKFSNEIIENYLKEKLEK